MEILDVVDKYGVPTGETVDRSVAHQKGIRHRTSHVWLFRRRNGVLEVLLQKRSLNKDSFPGCFDISTAGHIPAGDDFIPSAIREAREELGVTLYENEFIYCGQRCFEFQENFHGKLFRDCQVSNVYAVFKNLEAADFQIQKEELEAVIWMDFEECKKAVAENHIPNCIWMEELDMLDDTLKNKIV